MIAFNRSVLAALLARGVVLSPPVGGPAFTAQSATDAVVPNYNQVYHYAFSAPGATTYSLYDGAIPPGFSFATVQTGSLISGMLSGSGAPGGPLSVPLAAAQVPGSYTFRVQATGPNGTSISSPQTLVVKYQPRVMGAPVALQTIYYEIPGYTGAVLGQQWYANFPSSGLGPQPIAGATAAGYPVQLSDVGMFPSVHVTLPDGTVIVSGEFPALKAVLSQSGVQVGTLTTTTQGTGANNNEGAGLTVNVLSKVVASVGARYIESVVAPGVYPGQSSAPYAFGDLTAYANSFSTYLSYSGVLGTAATIAPLTPAAATATRPGTGIGLFTGPTGRLYDSNGNKFMPRGVNRYNYGTFTGMPPCVINSGANTVRIFLSNSFPLAQYDQPAIEQAIANKIIPVVCLPGFGAGITGSITGNILTVSSLSFGTIPASSQCVFSGTGVTSFYVLPFGTGGTTGTGREGTYQISVTQPTPVAAGTAMKGSGGSTNQSDPALLISIAQTWAHNFSFFSAYQKYMILNVCNEWGPVGSSTNTVWRDAYVQAIGILRAAGYTCPLLIDAPGSGQDSYALVNHSAAVFAADTTGGAGYSAQYNVLISPHLYGGIYKPGNLPALFAKLDNLRVNNPGLGFLTGEFGPQGHTNAPGWGWGDPQELMAHSEAFEIGWIAWATDDPFQSAHDYDFALFYNGSSASGYGSFATSDPNDCTIFGKQVLFSLPNGLMTLGPSSKATSFPS